MLMLYVILLTAKSQYLGSKEILNYHNGDINEWYIVWDGFSIQKKGF